MEVHEFILQKIRNNSLENMYVWGEGGIGKSYALRRLYSCLLNDEYYVGAKRVLPIYIPLAEVSIRGHKNETCIRQYIWNNYSCGQPTGRNTIANLDSQILNAPNSRYHFLLLCDGINENANGTALRTEISVLASSYENVTICLTGRNKIEWLNDFEYVEVAPLDLERVRNIVRSHLPENTLTEETLELLRNPFNLTQWLGLSEADKADDYTKSKLLKRHIDRLINIQNQHNSAQKYFLGNLTIYHETALKYVLRFLSFLSWESENENTMLISVNCPAWKRAKSLYTAELKNELKIIKEEIFDNFLIPLGLFRRIDDKYFTYTHQNYRDYFAALFLYDDNFGNFEYKISTYTISDSVLEFFAGFYNDKDALYDFAHEVNERISQCDVLKANAVLNKNIVRLFKETSNSIVNETFSNRDLCLADFNDFYELLDCDFSNSKFGEDTLWISNTGWNYDAPGDFFVTSKYLILNDSRKCILFDIHTLKFIKTIQCEARECFEYQNATYIASVEQYYDDDYVVVKNIENDDSVDIDLSLKEAGALIESESPHFGDLCIYDAFVEDISFCTLNSCLYILVSIGKLSQLFVYNFNCSSFEIINDVCFLGATNQNNTKHTYYCSKEDGLVILSDVGEFTIGFFEKENQLLYYNTIIDCYFINGDWVVITDTYIFSTGFSEHILFIPSKYTETTYDENINRTEKILDLANISSPCTLEFGLVVETEYDSYSNLIYMLVRENDCEQLLVYNPKNNTLSSCLNDLMKITGRFLGSQKKMFVEKRNLYIFENDTLRIGALSNSEKITFSNKKLDLRVFDVIKIDSGFALYDAFHSPEMPKMQKINFYGSTIFENKAHLIPSCIEMNCVNNQFSVLFKNHNHKPYVASFGLDFVLKSIRYFSNAPVNYKFPELAFLPKGWKHIGIQQLDKNLMYFGVGDKDFGLYIYRYDSEINQYGFLCQISSPISHEFPFSNDPNALIPNLYEAEVLLCNNSTLLLKGTSRTEEKHYTAENKYYRVDLELLQYCAIEIWNCDDTIFFDNSDLLLYTKDNSVHLYNMRSKTKTDLNDLNPMFFGENQEIDWVQEQNSDNLKQSFFSSFLQLVRCGKERGVYFENHLIWLSEINSKSVLTILSLKEKSLLIHEICDCMHEIILKYDELCQEVYVINESFVFDDDDLLTVDIFRNSDHGFERFTYVIDNPNISLNSIIVKNNRLYFIDSTGLHSRALNDEEESKLNVYPFDKDVTGSNFNGCQFNERQKRILTQYGAKPFTESKEEC